MESGVASWNKCYKNWRVFSPCPAQTSGRQTERGYLYSVASVEISSARARPEAFRVGGSSVLKESGHKSDLLDELSYNRHALESDIAH